MMSTPTYRTLVPLFEELRGERVVVRPYRESDAQALYEAVAESRDHLRPWMPFADEHQTLDESRNWILQQVANWILRFDNLKANRIEIRCDELNARSAAIPKRLGYALEGRLRNHLATSDGRLRTTLIFSLIPELFTPPAGTTLPFSWVRVRGNRAYISGHAPQNPDGSLAQPLGKVGTEVSIDEAYQAARLVALAMLGSLKRELGDLDRVTTWLRVHGMVNSAPGFTRQPAVINGFSDLIIELYGQEAGQHARSAVGMAELPFGIPVEIEAEVEIS